MSGYKLPVACVIKGKWFGSADCAACGGTGWVRGVGVPWKDGDCEPCGGIGMVAYDVKPAMWQGKSRWPFRLRPVRWSKWLEELTSPWACLFVCLVFLSIVDQAPWIVRSPVFLVLILAVLAYVVLVVHISDKRLKK